MADAGPVPFPVANITPSVDLFFFVFVCFNTLSYFKLITYTPDWVGWMYGCLIRLVRLSLCSLSTINTVLRSGT
jgi:uncharacterized protein involved in cysteine biosynthesis